MATTIHSKIGMWYYYPLKGNHDGQHEKDAECWSAVRREIRENELAEWVLVDAVSKDWRKKGRHSRNKVWGASPSKADCMPFLVWLLFTCISNSCLLQSPSTCTNIGLFSGLFAGGAIPGSPGKPQPPAYDLVVSGPNYGRWALPSPLGSNSIWLSSPRLSIEPCLIPTPSLSLFPRLSNLPPIPAGTQVQPSHYPVEL